uniref:NADH dehydrogenase subunit 2 n=1 Tax=Paradiplozoon yunnanensis TaxID=2268894 RepID=UPI001FAEF7B7
IFISFIWGFSLYFFILVFFESNFCLLILYLELVALLVIPLCCFNNFGFVGFGNRYVAVYTLFLVSSVSSLFLLYGWVVSSYYLIYLGLIIKLGLYPFCWWVPVVMEVNDFFFIFYVILFYKLPLVFVCQLGGGLNYWLFLFLVLFSFIFCVNSLLLVPCYSRLLGSWYVSSSLVILLCVYSVSFNILFVLFFFGWLYGFILLFCFRGFLFEESCLSSLLRVESVYFIFIFLSLPFSLSIFYKLLSCYCVFLVSFWFFLFWCLYQIVEQLWVFNLLFFLCDFGDFSEESFRLL